MLPLEEGQKRITGKCVHCYYTGDILIQLCQSCQRKGCDSDHEVEIDRKKQIYKLRNLEEEQKFRAQNIVESKNRLLDRHPEKSLWFAMTKQETDKLCREDRAQQKLLQNISKQSFRTYASQFNRDYSIQQPPSTRGPKGVPELKNFIHYVKPTSYFGIGLKNSLTRRQLSKDGNKQEWMVAYYGTSLESVPSILRDGFKLDKVQPSSKHYNINPYCLEQTIGTGIYCTPYIKTAEAYSKSSRYYVVLQCRVNPLYLKIANLAVWVVSQPKYIIPYRLLIRRKTSTE